MAGDVGEQDGDGAAPPAATQPDSLAGGNGAVASGEGSTAIGSGSAASEVGSSAFGEGTDASGAYASALGSESSASGQQATATGFRSDARSEEHTSELQSLMRISYAVFCLKKKTKTTLEHTRRNNEQANEKDTVNKQNRERERE